MNFLFILFTSLLLQSLPQDSISQVLQRSYNITPLVFHHPEKVIFNTRPYDIDLFVDFKNEKINSVSLFIKTDVSNSYTEYSMGVTRGRYRYRFDPNKTPVKNIEYFFIVTLKDFSIYAAPLDKNGYIKTVKRTLVDPAKYFKQRLNKRQ